MEHLSTSAQRIWKKIGPVLLCFYVLTTGRTDGRTVPYHNTSQDGRIKKKKKWTFGIVSWNPTCCWTAKCSINCCNSRMIVRDSGRNGTLFTDVSWCCISMSVIDMIYVVAIIYRSMVCFNKIKRWRLKMISLHFCPSRQIHVSIL